MTTIILSETSNESIAHILEEKEHWAIKAAVAANRPLLVRGEPGIGKTQLAWAAAELLNRPLLSLTVDSNTEARDLLWSFDAVQRLAEAQVAPVTTKNIEELRDLIAVKNFIKPGPIWFAFDWQSATDQLAKGQKPPARMPKKKWTPTEGVVVLIDEIDKAESDVPNGLLESLGYREFLPQGWDEPIQLKEPTQPPLIVITTNEERVLPDAFLRRCLVLPIQLPNVSTTEEQELFVEYLVKRGEAHFPKAAKIKITNPLDLESESKKTDPLPRAAAKLLLKDRLTAIRQHQTPIPGQAEYLDFLRAIMCLTEDESPQVVFQKVQSFVFRKSIGT